MDVRDDAVDILVHLFDAKAQHRPALALQECIAARIAIRIMPGAINLNSELQRDAGIVQVERFNRMLPTKGLAELAVA